MTALPKISIVVVNKNSGAFLEACLRSVLDQEYGNLELIMVDGGSHDESLEIIQGYQQYFSWWCSEEDEGQYAAVQKGFEHSSGEIMAWINSDDLYLPGAFVTVARIFSEFKQVDWLMGFPGEFDAYGVRIQRIGASWARWSQDRYLSYDFQFIQQESCFWRRELWQKAGQTMNNSFNLAGDMELWARFFRHAKLYTTLACFAGFRQHNGDQRSIAQRQAYLDQGAKIIQRELQRLPASQCLYYTWLRIFGWFFSPIFFFELPFIRRLYLRIYRIPPLINYDMDNYCYHYSEQLVKSPPLFIGGKSLHRGIMKKKAGENA